MATGLAQVPRDQAGNPFLSGVALDSLDSASQATGATPVTLFASQGGLIMNAQSGDSPALFDCKALTLIVGNNATAQTITGLSLALSGKTASGLTGSITYPITQDVTGAPVNIASGATQTFFVPLSKGVLPTLTLTPTFAAAPAAGDVECYTTAHGPGANGIVASLEGSLTTLDSTTTPLGASASYVTATPFSVSGFKSIVGSAYSDQSGTLLVEQSQDGTNFDVQSSIAITGGATNGGFDVGVVAPFARLYYTNGATSQTVFRLYARGKTL